MIEEIITAYQPFLGELTPEPMLIGTKGKPIPHFPVHYLLELCNRVNTIFSNEPPLLKLDGSFFIVGDIHGNIVDLLRILSYTGSPEYQKYLFLGDYVDRGEYSTEVVTLLFALKVTYPDQIYLLRGNHEFEFMNSLYGFKDEILSNYTQELYNAINNSFSYMPFAAVIGNHTFCVHGGLSPLLTTPEDIMSIPKPVTSYEDQPLLNDIIWSDPTLQDNIKFSPSPRGKGNLFGITAVDEFLETNHFKHIIRAHQRVINGIEKLYGEKLFTVFSSSSDGELPNKCGVLFVNQHGNTRMTNFQAIHLMKRSMCAFFDKTTALPLCKRAMIISQSQTSLNKTSRSCLRRKLPLLQIASFTNTRKISATQSKPTFPTLKSPL